MQIVLKDNQAVVTHDGKRLIFDLKEAFQSPHRSISRNPFREINLWFLTLPTAKQKAIFDIYEVYRKELTTNSNIDFHVERMSQLTEALYKFIDYESIVSFIKRENLIPVPTEGFETEHNPSDPNPQKTYIAREYHELMLCIVAMRPLFPVTFEYMTKLTKVYGKDYKEHYARLSLITSTWLNELPQLERLTSYIEASVEPKKDQISNIVFNAMSKEDFSDWVVSKVICRRLMTGEVQILPGVPNQIASIWSFIDNSVRQTPKIASIGDVALKNPQSETGDDHKSVADENRVRQNTTIGYLVRHEHYFSDVGRVVLQIDPTVPASLIRGAKRRPLTYGVNCIARWHTVFSQLIIADKISVLILEALTKPVHISALEVSRILLWHWGYKELALLISAEDVPVEVKENIEIELGAPINNRAEADDYLIERINTIYRLDEVNRRGKPKNHKVYTDLKDLAHLIPNRLWDVRPIQGVELPDYVDSTMKMKTPNDITNLVVKFAVDLAEKRMLNMNSEIK